MTEKTLKSVVLKADLNQDGTITQQENSELRDAYFRALSESAQSRDKQASDSISREITEYTNAVKIVQGHIGKKFPITGEDIDKAGNAISLTEKDLELTIRKSAESLVHSLAGTELSGQVSLQVAEKIISEKISLVDLNKDGKISNAENYQASPEKLQSISISISPLELQKAIREGQILNNTI